MPNSSSEYVSIPTKLLFGGVGWETVLGSCISFIIQAVHNMDQGAIHMHCSLSAYLSMLQPYLGKPRYLGPKNETPTGIHQKEDVNQEMTVSLAKA